MPDSPRFIAGPQISSDSIGKGIMAGAQVGADLAKAYKDAEKKAEKKPGSGLDKNDKNPEWTKPDDPLPGLYARGGKIRRTSGPKVGKDDGLIAAQKGEFVVRKSAVNKLGTKALNTINRGKLPTTKGKGAR